MSHLKKFKADAPSQPLIDTDDRAVITQELQAAGVRFEKWLAAFEVQKSSTHAEILKAYDADIKRLMREDGYQAVDVVRMVPDHPEKKVFRQKFLSEHTHEEDEVRFFVGGQGLFCLNIQGYVYMVLCVQGDLISVPDGVTHWFDMGENPDFTAIRLFNNPSGWVANFTGDPIAQNFPNFEEYLAA